MDDDVISAEHDLLNYEDMDEMNNDETNMSDYDTRSEEASAASDYDTRSEVSSSSSEDSGSDRREDRGRVAHRLTSEKKRDKERERDTRSSRDKDRDRDRKPKRDPYDYPTKLNYLFREARFFLMKSNNAENIALSKAKGVWSTLPQNEARLNVAVKESRNIIMVFSVKESGKFCGFARLSGESRRDVTPINWVLPPGLPAKALGGVFKVDWVCRKELPFTSTVHLYNPWNDGRLVKIGRDGQEIEPRVGQELCRLFPEDENIELTPILKKSKEMARELRENLPKLQHERDLDRRKARPNTGRHSERPRRKFMHMARPMHRSPYPPRELYTSGYMGHSLPPHLMYHCPPPPSIMGFDPQAPPRYYEGLALPPIDYYDKRSYDRSVQDFLIRNDRHRSRQRSREPHRSRP
uniref:YTH domain-containing protein 1 n=1 Tax=Lygus hesperus TaxID=30085 RepID=A0A0A9W0N2_LYGHE